MNYFVEWTPTAHDRLERIWMAAADPRLVLRAAKQLAAYWDGTRGRLTSSRERRTR
jgi:hypothetical protein